MRPTKTPITNNDVQSPLQNYAMEQGRDLIGQQRSLAQELRLMNQMRDHIALERRSIQIEKGISGDQFEQARANRHHAVPR